jgi:prepilin-type N-terminal cleavage/methylation domain-containing protein
MSPKRKGFFRWSANARASESCPRGSPCDAPVNTALQALRPSHAFGNARRASKRGFSLAEVLVALAVAAMLVAGLTRYVAGTRLGAAQVRERLELWSVAQSLLNGMPRELGSASKSGRIGAYRWRIYTEPADVRPVARAEAQRASSKSPEMVQPLATAVASNSWTLYRVSVLVEALSGRQHAADTIRIGH